ncbi:hypothetical protein [Streptomyces flavofungini]|uniref:hypothetical protein n=1 Tax=Streptomyces flavofungini TaxID=68200 RepID=UPI0034DE15E2
MRSSLFAPDGDRDHEGIARAANETLMARLQRSESWLGGAPETLVAGVRERLLAGTLAAFRRRATEDERLFRQLMFDTARAAGRESADDRGRLARVEREFGERLDGVIGELTRQRDSMLAATDETRQELHAIRRMASALLARRHAAQVTRLALPRRFRSFVSEKCRDFVGRDFVYQELESWIGSAPCGYFTVRADPGMGKSAVLANYVRRTGCLAYFNQRASGLTRASQFLESMCGQLVRWAGLPPDALPAEFRDGGVLAELLDEAAEAREGPLVLAVDALDEVDLTCQDRTANVLYLPAQLPEGVYVVTTKRDVPLPLLVEVPSHTLDLNAARFRAENVADAHAYLDRTADIRAVADWMRDNGLTRDAYTRHLGERSEANFMYLRHVVADIVAGRWTATGPEALPTGLRDYYANHWRVMGMETPAPPHEKLKVLYVLLEYQEPISVRLLSEITAEQATTVAGITREWSQFLRRDAVDGERRYSLYHESFAEFLRREEVLAASRIDLAEINEMISLRLLQGFG